MAKEIMKEATDIKVANTAAFGRYIRQLREARGITMAEMSRATGIPYHSVTAFEGSGRGSKGMISVEKAQVLYDYLQTLPVAKKPMRTSPGHPGKKRKHRRARVAKQTMEAKETKETPQPVEEKPTEQKPEEEKPVVQNAVDVELAALKYKQIRSLHDMIREADIRVLREYRHLLAEIDCSQTPAVVRSADVHHLITLVNFLKENWGYLV